MSFGCKELGTIAGVPALIEVVNLLGIPKPIMVEFEQDDRVSFPEFDEVSVAKFVEGIEFWRAFYFGPYSVSLLNGNAKSNFSVEMDWQFFLENKPGLLSLYRRILAKYPVEFSYFDLAGVRRQFLRKHFRRAKRSYWFRGFGWLQYFGKEEWGRQGGKAILNNPYYTKVEEINGGVLIQVGQDLEEVWTPEGEELLLNATAALPPPVRFK